MNENDVRLIFERIYHGQRNFMTSEIIRFGERPGFLYELSHGKFLDDHIYGVTVLVSFEGKWLKSKHLSECFPTLTLAERYISGLGEDQS